MNYSITLCGLGIRNYPVGLRVINLTYGISSLCRGITDRVYNAHHRPGRIYYHGKFWSTSLKSNISSLLCLANDELINSHILGDFGERQIRRIAEGEHHTSTPTGVYTHCSISTDRYMYTYNEYIRLLIYNVTARSFHRDCLSITSCCCSLTQRVTPLDHWSTDLLIIKKLTNIPLFDSGS